MTPTSALLAASGLSQREVASICSVSHHTVKSWSSGRLKTPESVIQMLSDIVAYNLLAASHIAAGGPSEGHRAIIVGLSLAMIAHPSMFPSPEAPPPSIEPI